MARFSDDGGLVPDIFMMKKGDAATVFPGPTLRADRWVGGTWVMAASPSDGLEFQVQKSDGSAALGFLFHPSENYQGTGGAGHGNWDPSQVASLESSTVASGACATTMISGGPRVFFKRFETVSLNGAGNRVGPAIVYSLNEPLKVSENGLLCNDTDANLTAAIGTAPIQVGVCFSIPSEDNSNRLGADIKF